MLTGWDMSKHRDYSDEILLRLPPEKRKGMVAPPVVGPQAPSDGDGTGNRLPIAGAALLIMVMLALYQQRRGAVARS
jgi:hypothetical protein